ncbi:MAG: twin-arginine translocase TatA/TatE family subunit [Alphaproteobacteria bacterium]|nr:twin-arginine translocase TatA/TatE family subunit [Alphaproteobacteria bacterium]
MFDFGWSELLLIMAAAVLVIGPKELPVMMRALGRIVRRIQYIRYAFSQQFEDFMEQNDLGDLHRSVNFEAKEKPRDFDEKEADAEMAETMEAPSVMEEAAERPPQEPEERK